MPSDLQRYRLKQKGPRMIVPDPDGFVVRFSDVQARLEAADREIENFTDEIERLQARIEELEARLGVADRLAEAVRAFHEESWHDELYAEMTRALAVYRSVGKNQEGQE